MRGIRIDLDKTRANARLEVARALEQFDSARVQLARYEEKILPDATWVVEAAEFAYKKGAIPLTDLLDARRQYYAAQRQLLELRMNFATADAALASSLEDASLEH
ncbi:MAG: TolC family protein [Cupriavidus sp.]|nr:TolC family protein [Cupriavidus sp.]